MSGAILAGGKGTRFGRDKMGLVVEGVPVVRRLVRLLSGLCEEVVVAAGKRRDPPFPLGAPLVEDRFPGKGPLAGIHAALANTAAEACLIVACDMPFVSRALLLRLCLRVGGDKAVVFAINGYIEPFPGIYPRNLLPRLEEALRRGELGVQRFLRKTGARLLPEEEARAVDPRLLSFVNVNSPRDLVGLLPRPGGGG